MDRAERIGVQKQVILDYARGLRAAGMSKEGVALNASFMTIAVILENITPPQMAPVVEEALNLHTQILMTYQKKVEDDLDLAAIKEAAQEANESLNEVYGDDD